MIIAGWLRYNETITQPFRLCCDIILGEQDENVHLEDENVHLEDENVHLEDEHVHLEDENVHLEDENVHLEEDEEILSMWA